MNGGQQAEQAPSTATTTATATTDNNDRTKLDHLGAATATATSAQSANNNKNNNIHPFLGMQSQPKQEIDAPSVTPAIATATGTANGSSNSNNNNSPSAAAATAANAAAAMSKKRKKDGLKPIITTENPHIGCVRYFSPPFLMFHLIIVRRVRVCLSSACISSPSCACGASTSTSTSTSTSDTNITRTRPMSCSVYGTSSYHLPYLSLILGLPLFFVFVFFCCSATSCVPLKMLLCGPAARWLYGGGVARKEGRHGPGKGEVKWSSEVNGGDDPVHPTLKSKSQRPGPSGRFRVGASSWAN